MFTISKSRKTVDTVIATFNRTLEELREVEAAEAAEALRQKQVAEDALVAKATAEAEAARAKSVASKIERLLG